MTITLVNDIILQNPTGYPGGDLHQTFDYHSKRHTLLIKELQPEAYSKHCQTSKMEPFLKIGKD